MKRIIDIENSPRKEHFAHFNSLQLPSVSLTLEVDCTEVYRLHKHTGVKFSTCLMYQIIRAADHVEEMRYRFDEGQVVCFDHLSISSTVLRPNGVYGCTYIKYADTLAAFAANTDAEHQAVLQSEGLRIGISNGSLDTIYYSASPWFRFTELLHPTSLGAGQGIQNMATGKYLINGESVTIPMNIKCNHALMDGYHIHQFFEAFQSRIIEP